MDAWSVSRKSKIRVHGAGEQSEWLPAVHGSLDKKKNSHGTGTTQIDDGGSK
jgi:hypothetical protein